MIFISYSSLAKKIKTCKFKINKRNASFKGVLVLKLFWQQLDLKDVITAASTSRFLGFQFLLSARQACSVKTRYKDSPFLPVAQRTQSGSLFT